MVQIHCKKGGVEASLMTEQEAEHMGGSQNMVLTVPPSMIFWDISLKDHTVRHIKLCQKIISEPTIL